MTILHATPDTQETDVEIGESKLGKIGFYLLLILFALFFLLPLLWMLVTAFKPFAEWLNPNWIPVNPTLVGKEILGQPVYGSLAEVPGPVDIVDIFRNSAAALEVTREAIGLKDKLGIKVIWMQLGVRNDEAAAEAEAAGLQVVMNRCPKIEYGRLSGEIGWAGVNAGTISSKRPLLGGRGVQNHVIAGKPR